MQSTLSLTMAGQPTAIPTTTITRLNCTDIQTAAPQQPFHTPPLRPFQLRAPRRATAGSLFCV